MIDVSGTHLQGHVTTTYAHLVETFGEPNAEGDSYKTQAEWNLTAPAGGVVTIYDYKQGACYRGDADGVAVEDVTEWHIGGRNAAVVAWVEEQLASGNVVAPLNIYLVSRSEAAGWDELVEVVAIAPNPEGARGFASLRHGCEGRDLWWTPKVTVTHLGIAMEGAHAGAVCADFHNG